MVDPDPLREPRPTLVFFDLDGTISRRDTLIGYVWGFAWRHPWRVVGFVAVVPALLAFAIGRIDRGLLKGALVRAVMGGSTRQDVADWTARYVPRLVARGCFPAALQAIARHREAGHHLVLMSATVDLYVPELARALGFDDWICSTVRWQGEHLDGRLSSRNVRGEEKAARLRAAVQALPGRRLVGYGNSRADLPHLRWVDEAVLINAGSRLRRAAGDLPVQHRTWL